MDSQNFGAPNINENCRCHRRSKHHNMQQFAAAAAEAICWNMMIMDVDLYVDPPVITLRVQYGQQNTIQYVDLYV